MTKLHTHPTHTEIVEDRRTDGIMVQRVLVPLDSSESSEQVAALFSGFFTVGEVEFVLFDLVAPGREKASSPTIEENAHLLRQAGYQVQFVHPTGDPAQAILDFVSEQHIDLVAIVSQSAASSSARERVLRGVNVPVLFMRAAE